MFGGKKEKALQDESIYPYVDENGRKYRNS